MAPPPRTGCLDVTPLPTAAAGGGARHTAPCPKRLPCWGSMSLYLFFFYATLLSLIKAGGGVNPAFPFVVLLQKQTWMGDCPLSAVLFSMRKALASPRRQEGCCWPHPGVHTMDLCLKKPHPGEENCQKTSEASWEETVSVTLISKGGRVGSPLLCASSSLTLPPWSGIPVVHGRASFLKVYPTKCVRKE